MVNQEVEIQIFVGRKSVWEKRVTQVVNTAQLEGESFDISQTHKHNLPNKRGGCLPALSVDRRPRVNTNEMKYSTGFRRSTSCRVDEGRICLEPALSAE